MILGTPFIHSYGSSTFIDYNLVKTRSIKQIILLVFNSYKLVNNFFLIPT